MHYAVKLPNNKYKSTRTVTDESHSVEFAEWIENSQRAQLLSREITGSVVVEIDIYTVTEVV